LPKPAVISIIDDDGSVRAAIHNLVRSVGYIVHTFASAEEFLRSPQLNATSCVIADVQMPTMSGVELQASLLAQGNRVPFIFITAFPAESARASAEGRSDLFPDQAFRRRSVDQMPRRSPGRARRESGQMTQLGCRGISCVVSADRSCGGGQNTGRPRYGGGLQAHDRAATGLYVRMSAPNIETS
jgi:CheY-like chemotaxis protein